MELIKPQEQQNIFDIALQAYGSIEGVFEIMENNEIDVLDTNISVYEEYEVINQPIKFDIKNFYDERNILPASGVTDLQLDLLNISDLPEGIGVMVVEGDFVIPPNEETELVTLEGRIFPNSSFRKDQLGTFFFSKSIEDNDEIAEITLGDLQFTNDEEAYYPFSIKVAKSVEFIIGNYDKSNTEDEIQFSFFSLRIQDNRNELSRYRYGSRLFFSDDFINTNKRLDVDLFFES